MLAVLEDDHYKLYDEQNQLIGQMSKDSDNKLKTSEITVGTKSYQLDFKKGNFTISEDHKIVYHIKSHFPFGTLEIKETKQKIKGVFGLKWGTQLVDSENNTLLKIRNDDLMVDHGDYVIENTRKGVSELEVLMTLFAHLRGGRRKQMLMFIVAVPIAIFIGKYVTVLM